jgi:hypothetical protein
MRNWKLTRPVGGNTHPPGLICKTSYTRSATLVRRALVFTAAVKRNPVAGSTVALGCTGTQQHKSEMPTKVPKHRSSGAVIPLLQQAAPAVNPA